ncbi:hypothetical protein HPB51_016709 [Rhipicephalus microplus]|uniref:Matrix-remodeling-associated protein 7 helical domain-containing protein n=1 Tax=Rhipicephalus microplus TaxID=6941 RepID=A0A9J6DAJ0_RHIMP|nr:hypothetical protein HPB51_016709 [Rhipicephalus microplus]
MKVAGVAVIPARSPIGDAWQSPQQPIMPEAHLHSHQSVPSATIRQDVDSCELSEEEKERMTAKPQAAKAAESLIEATMTEEQKTLEKEAQRKQLEEIYRLMAAHSDKFGDTSMEDIVNQMTLYR